MTDNNDKSPRKQAHKQAHKQDTGQPADRSKALRKPFEVRQGGVTVLDPVDDLGADPAEPDNNKTNPEGNLQ